MGSPSSGPARLEGMSHPKRVSVISVPTIRPTSGPSCQGGCLRGHGDVQLVRGRLDSKLPELPSGMLVIEVRSAMSRGTKKNVAMDAKLTVRFMAIFFKKKNKREKTLEGLLSLSTILANAGALRRSTAD
jgi:hypothetical protein